ncbi:tetratricopeptide repeat protein [candidate division KSB1 bacterium]|nr:tetratricopeptide repeat protein [candidate division KSB1 bacterium]
MKSVLSEYRFKSNEQQTTPTGVVSDQPATPRHQQQATNTNGKASAPGQLPPRIYLPFNRNPNFTGRDNELEKLHHLLDCSDNLASANQCVAITGVAGIGKTQLAVEYAFRYGQFYSGGVYWMNAASSENFQSALAALAVPMGLNLPMKLSDQIVAEHVLAFLRQPEPRLLILDDVKDSTVLSQYAIESGGCRVLMTSRHGNWPGITRLPVAVLKKDAALTLLLSRRFDLQASTDHSERQIAEIICDRLGYLPLALELAAFYLGRYKHLSLADYLKGLETIVPSHQIDPVDGRGKKSLAGYKQAAAVALQLNSRELAKTPDAARLFFAAQQFASEPINLNLLGKVANIDLATPKGAEALKLLQELCLCKISKDGRLQLHHLLSHLGQKLATRKGLAMRRERFVVALLEFIKASNDSTQLKAVALELPQVIKAAEIAISRKAWPWDFELCNQIGAYFKDRGENATCLKWWQRAQQICEAHQPFAEELLVSILNNRGHVFQLQGDWISAFTQYKQALAIRKKRFGEEHPEVARSFDNLGELLGAQGNRDGALTLHRRALAIRKNVLGEEHPEVVASLMKIGEILRLQRDYAGAFAPYRQALAILQNVYGEAHPYVVTCLDNMGRVLEAQGDWAGALTYYKQALAIRRQVLGEEHPEVATNLNNIGLVLHAQQDWTGAIEHLRRALAILKKHFDLEYSDTQTVRENLASIERERAATKRVRKIDSSDLQA